MRLTRKEHAIVSAITSQHRQLHGEAGGREIREVFNRARAAVLDGRHDEEEKRAAAPSFHWRKPAPRR